MKTFFLTLLLLFSFNIYAFPITKLLYCSSPKVFALHVNVTATDQENYRIKLMDQYSYPIQVYNSKLTFNEVEEIIKITASGSVELLDLEIINESWVGVFWFDNVRYQLTCKNGTKTEHKISSRASVY